MKKYIFIITSIILVAIAVVVSFCGKWEVNVNVIDFATLIATTGLTIIVFIYTIANEKKNISSDLVIEDLIELCAIYASNTLILSELETDEKKLQEVRGKIRFNFHKADCLIDTINAELKESFPDFQMKESLTEITKTYINWLTGGKFMEENFVIDKDFLRENETKATETIRKIRLVAHNLIKQ